MSAVNLDFSHDGVSGVAVIQRNEGLWTPRTSWVVFECAAKRARSIVEGLLFRNADLDEGTPGRFLGFSQAVKQSTMNRANCGLDIDGTTNSPLVLVNLKMVTDNLSWPQTLLSRRLKAVFRKREPKSVTAEITPRVRADGHPNYRTAKDAQETAH